MSALQESIRKLIEFGMTLGELKAAREERDRLRERVKQLEAERLERRHEKDEKK